mmetsp:Transcript_16182/g.32800  ORF Transcript_16182/g.32800 Transcript_16182/m.32800 type:complete len:190 (+) Transcript_16182:2037-2606(+)
MGDVTVAWFDEYDVRTRRWRRLPDAPNARDHHRAILYQSRIFLAGGRNSQRRDFLTVEATLRMLDIYDFRTRRWTSTPDILPPPGHAACGLASIGMRVVITGGEIDNPDQSSPIKTVKLVDTHQVRIGSYQTQFLGNLSQPRNYPGCSSCGGRIFCVGGGRDTLQNTMEYVVINAGGVCQSTPGYWSFT